MSTEGSPGNQIIMTNSSENWNGLLSKHSKVSMQDYSDQNAGVEHSSLGHWRRKRTIKNTMHII
jgi:hypothetical protein